MYVFFKCLTEKYGAARKAKLRKTLDLDIKLELGYNQTKIHNYAPCPNYALYSNAVKYIAYNNLNTI